MKFKLALLGTLMLTSAASLANPIFFAPEQKGEIIEAQSGNVNFMKDVKDERKYFPNCQYLDQIEHNVALDRLWYIARPMSVVQRKIGDRHIIKLNLDWGLGACEEVGYSRFRPSRSSFVPHDAWPLESDGRIKTKKPFVLKAYASTILAKDPTQYGMDIVQDRVALTLDKDLLLKELKVTNPIDIKVHYTMHGLRDGFFLNHHPFIKLTYTFELQPDGKVQISLKLK